VTADLLEDKVPRAVGRPEGVWQIHESGSSESRIDALIDRVIERARPATEDFAALAAEPETSCILRLVVYLDGYGNEPSWGLDEEAIAFLHHVRAFVDADWYQLWAPGRTE
jgi:hypothetical protein